MKIMLNIREITRLLPAICLILLFCGQAQAGVEGRREVLHDFRDIPGITAEEISAVEALKQRYPSLTYGMLNTTETFMRDDGTIGGYSALLCAWLSDLFEITFVPRVYDWDTLITGFEQGKIDFTGELTATPERREKYLMTDTFTERAIMAFRPLDSRALTEIAKYRKPRYAFLYGTTTIDAVAGSAEFAIEPVLVDTEKEAIAKLRSGEVDAFLAEEHGAAVFPDDIAGENIFPVVYSPISFSTARKELAPIVLAFDKYLKSGAFFHLTELYNQGHEEYLRHKLLTRLTEEEKAYLAEHRKGGTPVPIAAEYDTYPASFYNKEERAWQGIAIDVLARISDLSGLEFKVVNQPDEPWTRLFERLKSGEVAMVTELIYSNDRKGRFLWAAEPYASDYYALLSLIEHEDVSINQILHSRVGLVAESAYADVFAEWFPDHKNVVRFASSQDAFAAMEKDEIDLFMASRNLLLSATNYHENPAYKANLIFNRTYDSSFGFSKDEKLLCSIISKAQRLVDTPATAERWTRKVFDYRSKMARAQIPYLVGLLVLLGCVLALTLVILRRNSQMKKKLELIVKKRTAELEVQIQGRLGGLAGQGRFSLTHEP